MCITTSRELGVKIVQKYRFYRTKQPRRHIFHRLLDIRNDIRLFLDENFAQPCRIISSTQY